MEPSIVLTLATLGNESRLAVLRRLVEQGPRGATAGEISMALSVTSSTLSFHLNKLRQADLVSCRRDGRTLVYVARSSKIEELIDHLAEHYSNGIGTRRVQWRASQLIPALAASVVSLFGSTRSRQDKHVADPSTPDPKETPDGRRSP